MTKIGILKKAKYPFGDYASYADMVKYMRTIEFYYPRIAKIVRIGSTHEGKPIEGLKVCECREVRGLIGLLQIGANSSQKKRAVWVDGNIHAREWASSHTALYFINQVIVSPRFSNLMFHSSARVGVRERSPNHQLRGHSRFLRGPLSESRRLRIHPQLSDSQRPSLA